ncbi:MULTISPECIES: RNA methyltransferase [unclassified Thomasclavelia]|uniref:RNA methyltransferase n=1 Tax=Candidatus Erysipelatoclostridium merdavium TaxID=2838566 RepID=A0A9D2BNF5_9FIRM|nr:RNA methyltransferase [Erysipelatoclostridium sp. An15]OUQ06334.1 rRNA methyltransferase [Erysipelatoclostridium sp. An15]HIX82481.1 RNA methyltransferase [Candidatus Erysipelatoclostridium merdavium]
MITSTNNNTIKTLIKLKQKKYRNQFGYYLIEGEHLVNEALKANQVECIITTKPLKSNLEVIEVSEEVMAKLAFTKSPSNIMAKCKIDSNNELMMKKRYLILDDLQDPGNIGTLIRSALAFGIDQVILSKNCVDLYNDKLLRAMQGANFHISCIYGDLTEIIEKLQANGVVVVGSALENGQDISLIEKTEKMAFIVGNEGNGMNQNILDKCDYIGYIPIQTIESLNVAIAGSILMYHFSN